jgi:hypothetical protein
MNKAERMIIDFTTMPSNIRTAEVWSFFNATDVGYFADMQIDILKEAW